MSTLRELAVMQQGMYTDFILAAAKTDFTALDKQMREELRIAWTSVRTLAVAYGSPASERAADEALARLDEPVV